MSTCTVLSSATHRHRAGAPRRSHSPPPGASTHATRHTTLCVVAPRCYACNLLSCCACGTGEQPPRRQSRCNGQCARSQHFLPQKSAHTDGRRAPAHLIDRAPHQRERERERSPPDSFLSPSIRIAPLSLLLFSLSLSISPLFLFFSLCLFVSCSLSATRKRLPLLRHTGGSSEGAEARGTTTLGGTYLPRAAYGFGGW